MSTENATCSIVLRGPIDASWDDYFGDLMLFSHIQSGHIALTTLSGPLPDLAAFLGLVARVQNRGLTVLSAHYDCVPEVVQEN